MYPTHILLDLCLVGKSVPYENFSVEKLKNVRCVNVEQALEANQEQKRAYLKSRAKEL